MYPNKIRSIKDLDEAFYRMSSAIDWEYCRKFFKAIKNLDKSVLKKFFKQVEKILKNPNVGKYLYANRKGQRELYVASSFRLSGLKKLTVTRSTTKSFSPFFIFDKILLFKTESISPVLLGFKKKLYILHILF